MKAEKMRELDTLALERQLQEMTDQLFHLRFQIRMGQTDGLKKYRGLRKDRARIETILTERRMAESRKG
ncbi:MAG: 50S ribosomal protein L29 [Rhodospirillales bacterium]